MSELQGAVAVAQLTKLEDVVARRRRSADRLTELLAELRPAVETPLVSPRAEHTYWKYCLHVDERRITGGASGMARLLKEKGIASAPRYIQKPAFMCEVFSAQRTFGTSRYPFTLARPAAVDYERSKFPGTFAALDHILVLPWNELYTDEHVDYIAAAIHEAASALTE